MLLVEYIARWGVRVTNDRPANADSSPTYFHAPLHALADQTGWDAKFDPKSHPGFDPVEGFVYWPSHAHFPDRGLPHWNNYLILHELAHMLVGRLPAEYSAEDGLMCSFEWASVCYLRPTTHVDRWIDWRQTTGGVFESPLLHAKRHFPALVVRGFFHKNGVPRFRPFQPRPIPSPLAWAIPKQKTG